MLEAILKQKNMSIYQCAKLSGIPYTTMSEVVHGKTRIEKCSAEVVYKLSKVLGISMEVLIADSIEVRSDFEIFKSNICHKAKDSGDFDFIVSVLESDDIRRYWSKKWYPEAFYLLAMVDYLSRENNVPMCNKYDDIRSQSLKSPLYPKDVLMAAKLSPALDRREECIRAAIPEFMRFNIVESEVRNVY
jgi:transcriptional regulator with XRE-family HTH domain